jgi:hypothetical protein
VVSTTSLLTVCSAPASQKSAPESCGHSNHHSSPTSTAQRAEAAQRSLDIDYLAQENCGGVLPDPWLILVILAECSDCVKGVDVDAANVLTSHDPVYWNFH